MGEKKEKQQLLSASGEPYLSISELAADTKIAEKFLRLAIKHHGLPHRDFGAIKVLRSEFDQWSLQQRKIKMA